jgi:hypothetical protein
MFFVNADFLLQAHSCKPWRGRRQYNRIMYLWKYIPKKLFYEFACKKDSNNVIGFDNFFNGNIIQLNNIEIGIGVSIVLSYSF